MGSSSGSRLLSRSLDLGHSVAQFGLNRADPDFSPVLDCIRRQIAAPLILRCFGSDRATVLVRDHANKLRAVGDIGSSVGWSELLRHSGPTQEVVIRLTDSDPPPVTSPSGVDQWFDSGGHGAQ